MITKVCACFIRLGRALTCVDLEDELQNVEMAEEDRRKKNQDLKIKRRDYTGYDDEEFEPGKVGIRRGVLSKYDTVIDGEKALVRRHDLLWNVLLITF